MIEVFMLLFNFTLTTPEGAPRQEIINVYSKHFETRIPEVHICLLFFNN